MNKIPEFHQLLYCGKYDILCVTETWLHDGVNSGLLDPLCRFNIIMKDRDSGYGGVAVFVKRDIRLVDITVDTVYESLELVCFDVYVGKCKIRFFVIYRPPYYDEAARRYADSLIKCLRQYHSVDERTVNVIAGYLNCPKIDWINLWCCSDYISKSLFFLVYLTRVFPVCGFSYTW